MKKNLGLLVIVLFLSQSCTRGKNVENLWKNDLIDPAIRKEMTTMNKQVYTYLAENDYSHLEQLFSDSLKSIIKDDFKEKFMVQIQKTLKGKKYKMFDEFYLKETKPKDTIRIPSGKGDDAYTFEFKSKTKDAYVSIIVAGDSMDELLIILVYGNYNGKWKLEVVRGDDYAVKGMNAMAWYNKAMQLYKNEDIVDAANTLNVANYVATPGGPYFIFNKKKEIKEFTDSLDHVIENSFLLPYTVNDMKSKPQVFNIHYIMMNATLVPMLMYVSTINVKDTVELKAETYALNKKVGKIFHGLNKNHELILYRAYNEKPANGTDPAYYGFVVKTE